MRFLCLYKPSQAEGAPPTQGEMVAMGKLIDEMTRARCCRPKDANQVRRAHAFGSPAERSR